jgi:hypothetical protein
MARFVAPIKGSPKADCESASFRRKSLFDSVFRYNFRLKAGLQTRHQKDSVKA